MTCSLEFLYKIYMSFIMYTVDSNIWYMQELVYYGLNQQLLVDSLCSNVGL